jgi:GH24 family phage-related lysozyme (muramidase)
VTYVPSSQCLADKRRWEGSSLVVYADSRGLATQGIGRHHGVSFGDPPITAETEARWLGEDLQGAYAAAGRLFSGLAALDAARLDAVVDLCFNLGEEKLSVFQPFIKAVNAKQWSEASFHLLTNTSGHLTPYLTQVGARAIEVALRIATGEVPAEFKV